MTTPLLDCVCFLFVWGVNRPHDLMVVMAETIPPKSPSKEAFSFEGSWRGSMEKSLGLQPYPQVQWLDPKNPPQPYPHLRFGGPGAQTGMGGAHTVDVPSHRVDARWTRHTAPPVGPVQNAGAGFCRLTTQAHRFWHWARTFLSPGGFWTPRRPLRGLLKTFVKTLRMEGPG